MCWYTDAIYTERRIAPHIWWHVGMSILICYNIHICVIIWQCLSSKPYGNTFCPVLTFIPCIINSLLWHQTSFGHIGAITLTLNGKTSIRFTRTCYVLRIHSNILNCAHTKSRHIREFLALAVLQNWYLLNLLTLQRDRVNQEFVRDIQFTGNVILGDSSLSPARLKSSTYSNKNWPLNIPYRVATYTEVA